MRAVLCSTLLVVVLLAAAGCGGGGGGGGGGSTAGGGGKPSGEAGKSANAVLADAIKAADAASSVRMSGQIAASGRQVGVDLSIVKGKGATGTLTLSGSKIDIVLIGKKGYMRAPTAFWTKFAGASGAAIGQLLAGKWLAFPADNAQFGSFTGIANDHALFDQLRHHGTLANDGTTTYKGQSVIKLADTTKSGTLYVAASGTPYPVALVLGKKSDSGTVTFDRWGQSVSLTAPSGAIDFSHLTG